jgi:hypothetical protein
MGGDAWIDPHCGSFVRPLSGIWRERGLPGDKASPGSARNPSPGRCENTSPSTPILGVLGIQLGRKPRAYQKEMSFLRRMMGQIYLAVQPWFG